MTLPALPEGKSDIPLRVTSFLDKFCDPQRGAHDFRRRDAAPDCL
jgi:hypothetical protein